MFFNDLRAKSIFLLALILLFTACSTSDRGCRSGDNFDGNSTEFDSYFPANADEYRDKNGRKLSDDNDLIGWQDTGLITNGEDIVVDIVGRWSPWGSGAMKRESLQVDEQGKARVVLESIEKKCTKFAKKDVFTVSDKVITGRYISLSEPKTGSETEYPCWLSDGIGMYLLIRDTKSNHPNETSFIVKSPNSGTIHLNDDKNPTKTRFVISANGSDSKLIDGVSIPHQIKKGMEIYGKIYDSFYLDNYGTYQLNFISGVYKKERTPMFEGCRKYILDPIKNISKKIFLNIVSDPAYKKGIYALLILYITITGLLYLIGIIQAQLGELTLRLFKIGLVLVILTPNAWNFFYNNLFSAYLEGIDQMINIIVSSDKYDSSNPMGFMDRITEKIINPLIGDRAVAAFNANFLLGPIFIFFLMLIILFFSICVVFCFACYIIGMILLYIATTMFPIFIAMILFNVTRQIFQEYINTILGYSFQVVMSFVVLFFMANIIQYEIQRALGFRMCVAPIVNLNPFSGTSPNVLNRYKDLDNGEVETQGSGLTIMGWAPGEGHAFLTIPGWSILIPGYNIYELFAKVHYRFKFSEIEEIAVPPNYEKVRYRYTSLPFLEPDINFVPKINMVGNRPQGMTVPPGYSACKSNPTKDNCHPDKVFPDGIGQDDHKKIADMMFKDHSYNFFDFGDLFIIILFMFVLWELCINYIRTISEYIGIGGEGYTMPQGTIGVSITQSFQQYVKYVSELAQKDGVRGIIGKGLMLITTDRGFIMQQLTMKTGAKLSDYMDDKLSLSKLLWKEGEGPQDSKNGAVRFVAQLSGAIYDSVRYEDLESRSVSNQMAEKERSKYNMRGIHHLQDSVGSYFDYAGAIMDKMGQNSLQNLNPFHSNAQKWLGGYDFDSFDKKTMVSFKETEGVIGRIANVAAGDSINRWSMENGYGKVFEHNPNLVRDSEGHIVDKDGRVLDSHFNVIEKDSHGDWNLKKDLDGNSIHSEPAESKWVGFKSALEGAFTENTSMFGGYKGIANYTFADYQSVVDREYNNSFKDISGNENSVNGMLGNQVSNQNQNASMTISSGVGSQYDGYGSGTQHDDVQTKVKATFVGSADHDSVLSDMIAQQNMAAAHTLDNGDYPEHLNPFNNYNSTEYPEHLNPFMNNNIVPENGKDAGAHHLKLEEIYVEKPQEGQSEIFKALSGEGGKGSSSSNEPEIERENPYSSYTGSFDDSRSFFSDSSSLGGGGHNNEVISNKKSDSLENNKVGVVNAEQKIDNNDNSSLDEVNKVKDNKLSDKSVAEDENEKLRAMSLNQQIEYVDQQLRDLYNTYPDGNDPEIQRLEKEMDDLLKKKGF